MHKKIPMPSSPNPHCIARQPHPLRAQLCKHCVNPIHLHCHMVQSLATLGHKPPNRRILFRCLQQFNPARSQRKHGRLHLFMLHCLLMTHHQPQCLIESPRRRNTLHRNSQMIQMQIRSQPSCHSRSTRPRRALLLCIAAHRLHQLLHPFSGSRNRPHHRRDPSSAPGNQPLHRNNLLLHQLRAPAVTLIHHKNIRHLHHPGLQALDFISHPRHQHQHRHICQANHINLILPHPHRRLEPSPAVPPPPPHTHPRPHEPPRLWPRAKPCSGYTLHHPQQIPASEFCPPTTPHPCKDSTDPPPQSRPFAPRHGATSPSDPPACFSLLPEAPSPQPAKRSQQTRGRPQATSPPSPRRPQPSRPL